MKIKFTSTNYKTLLLAVLLLSIAIGASFYIANQRLQAFSQVATEQVAAQVLVLSELSDTIAQNGVDGVTTAVLRDCSNSDRTRFDSLLGQLDQNLPQTELKELEQLFDSCAGFFAQQKALMAAQFGREVEVYDQQVTLLTTLTLSDVALEASVQKWRELLSEEQTQSTLVAELVVAQKQIIDTLLIGKTAQSEEIQAILATVLDIREALVFSKQKATALRSELTAL